LADSQHGFATGSTASAVFASEHSERGNPHWTATAWRALRPGHVHSAEGWRVLLEPVDAIPRASQPALLPK
jgi:hypothetical protein